MKERERLLRVAARCRTWDRDPRCLRRGPRAHCGGVQGGFGRPRREFPDNDLFRPPTGSFLALVDAFTARS
eukprot:3542794-Rhodomonas_salina.1